MNEVKLMKKLYPIFLAIIIGCGLAFFIFRKIEKNTFESEEGNAVAVQIGVFKTLENANKMKENYGGVVFEDEGLYRVYYSILNRDENIEFIKDYLNKKGINYYLKDLNLNNDVIKESDEYETLMTKTNEESKLSINEKLLNIYKEVV